jgi:hypothetical protein
MVEHFLDAYRAGFEAFAVEAMLDLFSYPCQITSDAGEVTVTTVGTREAWAPQIDRLVAAYRETGVRTAEVLELRVTEFTSLLAQVTVHRALPTGRGDPIYDFGASYTLADRGDGMRITAIAHNKTPRPRRPSSVSGPIEPGSLRPRRNGDRSALSLRALMPASRLGPSLTPPPGRSGGARAAGRLATRLFPRCGRPGGASVCAPRHARVHRVVALSLSVGCGRGPRPPGSLNRRRVAWP